MPHLAYSGAHASAIWRQVFSQEDVGSEAAEDHGEVEGRRAGGPVPSFSEVDADHECEGTPNPTQLRSTYPHLSVFRGGS